MKTILKLIAYLFVGNMAVAAAGYQLINWQAEQAVAELCASGQYYVCE